MGSNDANSTYKRTRADPHRDICKNSHRVHQIEFFYVNINGVLFCFIVAYPSLSDYNMLQYDLSAPSLPSPASLLTCSSFFLSRGFANIQHLHIHNRLENSLLASLDCSTTFLFVSFFALRWPDMQESYLPFFLIVSLCLLSNSASWLPASLHTPPATLQGVLLSWKRSNIITGSLTPEKTWRSPHGGSGYNPHLLLLSASSKCTQIMNLNNALDFCF